mgnify:CR=1
MMNRIILIGNGFDLAHKLATSYADFINWYWDCWLEQLKNSHEMTVSDELCSISNKYGCWNIHLKNLLDKTSYPKGWPFINFIRKDNNYTVNFSLFLNNICQSIETKGWVDIEKEYYDLLRVSVNKSQQVTADKLNKELKYLQSRLIEYLKEIDNRLNGEIVNAQIRKYMFEPIEEDDISIGSKDIFSMYMRDRDKWSMGDWQRIRKSYQGLYFEDMCDKYNLERLRTECRFLPDRIMLLNFNYTRTADIYLENADKLRFSVNHIHGTLTEPRSVIFGYGDELDDDYKALLKCNDNSLLRNIKSIRYTETDKYRKFLSFIESSPFQIYIMGHSCGNSDRTLLNTLFEHKNCVSIKPFYYVKADGTDNYLDIAQNISRNFTDMKLMRDRVVNREYCKVLS